MKKLSYILLALVVGSFFSCRREGCTDQNATNYDEKAKNDDGSCIYEGGNGGNVDNPDYNLAGTMSSAQVITNIFESSTAFDYYVQGTWTIDAAVEIEPGVRILMRANSKVRITANGSLNATGTENAPIHFIAEQDVQGFWYNIEFDGSNNPNNRLIYTTVHGAGGQSTRPASVYVRNNSRLIMQNSTITKGERNGLELNSVNGVLTDFESNTISNCNLNAIKLDSWRQAAEIDFATNFTNNNAFNRVVVGNSALTTPATINKIDGPFYVEGMATIESDLTITEGTEILMGPGAGVFVNSSGSLSIQGTASDRVTIKGGQEVPGYWGAIRYEGTVSANNVIQYTDINHGGGTSTRPGNIYLRLDAQISMGNSSSNHSQRWGVNGTNGSVFNDLGNNTYTGNQEGDNSFN
jgi:hypothetical protein